MYADAMLCDGLVRHGPRGIRTRRSGHVHDDRASPHSGQGFIVDQQRCMAIRLACAGHYNVHFRHDRSQQTPDRGPGRLRSFRRLPILRALLLEMDAWG